MAKGIAFDEEIKQRCLHAMGEGVPLATISLVEGVALPTLYMWKLKAKVATESPDEIRKLRAENERLRGLLRTLMAEEATA